MTVFFLHWTYRVTEFCFQYQYVYENDSIAIFSYTNINKIVFLKVQEKKRSRTKKREVPGEIVERSV